MKQGKPTASKMPNKKKKQLLRYEELMEEKEQEISKLRSMIAGNENREAGIGAGNTGQTVILRELEFWSFVLFNDTWSRKGHSVSNTTVILA